MIICYIADSKGINKGEERTFISIGFKNWKKTIDKFNNHKQSCSHIDNIECILSLESNRTILTQINEHFTAYQIIWRGILNKITTAIKYLSSEGMALREHQSDDRHFLNLLKLRAEDDTNILRAINTKHANI